MYARGNEVKLAAEEIAFQKHLERLAKIRDTDKICNEEHKNSTRKEEKKNENKKSPAAGTARAKKKISKYKLPQIR